MARLITPRSPALPIAQQEYTKTYQDTSNNLLRLYFRELDAVNSALFGPLGMHFLNSPYIGASSSLTQYATANDTPTLIEWDTVEARAGFALNMDGSATVPVSGTYKIDFSLQFANNDNVAHDVFVWLVLNDVPVANSSSRFSLAARKSSTDFTYVVGYSSVVFPAFGGDKFKLYWATSQAADSGSTPGIYMVSLPAQTTPYVRPANPSAIGSIVFISCPCDFEQI